ncbi:hypothetical protein RUMOBE_03509 [Blautia obeum ATCC 29174]|uniref:Uncharacterized protein n=1 Tax=Blautia obeum ATCC 29174 TaxID=411459 RepID=A5ZWW5_9FIRM|nr:hypothetical protein RUMOBE_03509 [Blautia obeum ATCC 29174]
MAILIRNISAKQRENGKKKKKCLDSIILEQTGSSLCNPGIDLHCFIESQSAGRD